MGDAPAVDEHVARLARLFREHPAWRAAARRLSPAATSTVYFTHLSSRAAGASQAAAWRLEQRGGETELLPGAAPDPDLVFGFSPEAIERLAAVEGGMDDFAVVLFQLLEDGTVGLRLAAPFRRLFGRGYVKLLLTAGPAVLAFGAARGVRTVGALRRLVAEVRSDTPADWEA